MKRIVVFARSVIPQDTSQLLLLAGSVPGAPPISWEISLESALTRQFPRSLLFGLRPVLL
jgi:hypothetical protein